MYPNLQRHFGYIICLEQLAFNNKSTGAALETEIILYRQEAICSAGKQICWLRAIRNITNFFFFLLFFWLSDLSKSSTVLRLEKQWRSSRLYWTAGVWRSETGLGRLFNPNLSRGIQHSPPYKACENMQQHHAIGRYTRKSYCLCRSRCSVWVMSRRAPWLDSTEANLQSFFELCLLNVSVELQGV